MSLQATGGAIAAVTKILKEGLETYLAQSYPVHIGRPGAPAAGTSGTSGIDLLLYEVNFDASLKNVSIPPSSQPPAWLVLKYFLSTHDASGESGTIEALSLLGQSVQFLQGVNFLANDTSGLDAALVDNPESLKITFDEAPSDFLARISQSSGDVYRCGITFQVRPVLVAAEKPFTIGPIVGVKGVIIQTFAGTPAVVTGITPNFAALGDNLLIAGSGFDTTSTLTLRQAATTVNLPLSPRGNSFICSLADVADKLSAGSCNLTVLAAGANAPSPAQSLTLLPTLDTARMSGTTLQIEGRCFKASDAVRVQLLSDSLPRIDLTPNANSIVVTTDTEGRHISKASIAIPNTTPPGTYQVSLMVNGALGRQNKSITWPGGP